MKTVRKIGFTETQQRELLSLKPTSPHSYTLIMWARSDQVRSGHATPIVNSTPYNATGCTTKDGFFRAAGLRHAPGMRDSNEDSSSAQPERRSMPSYRELSVILVKMKHAKYIG